MSRPLRTPSRNYLSFVRDLIRAKRTRDRESLFVLEGSRAILDLVRSFPEQIISLIMVREFFAQLPKDVVRLLHQGGSTMFTCPPEQFASVSDVETSSGALAIVRQPVWNQSVVLKQSRVLGLYGDRIQDPTNIGVIIRTAAGFGASALWLAPHSVDVFNPKVVRATAGTLFKLPIFFRVRIEELVDQQCVIVAADAATRESRSLRSMTAVPPRTVIAIGSEGRGLSDVTLAAAKLRVTIPLQKGVESLNVAAATAVMLFHFSALPLTEG